MMKKQNTFGEIIFNLRLTWKLFLDKRVPFYVKIIPVAALIYLVVPYDLLIGPIDDAALIAGAVKLFITLCPADVVEEHSRVLQGEQKKRSSSTIRLLDEDSPDAK